MTDVELTRALERGEIPNNDFRHASHLHVAWVYLAESSSVREAANKMRNTLSRFAATAGKPESITRPLRYFGCISSHTRALLAAQNAWKTSSTQIRNCWKRIFHSLTIRPNGFSATKRERHG